MCALMLAALCGSASQAAPSIRVVPGEEMNIDTTGIVVTQATNSWRITTPMRDDNGNASLGTSFRRWWHFAVDGLNAATGSTLDFSVTKAGYTDAITPVWSLDGGQTYARIPGVLPTYSSSSQTQSFTITTPPGVTSIRLAKYFPYTIGMNDRFRASVAGSPFVREEVIGHSAQGRSIVMQTLTDSSVPDAGKERVWIHAAVHPSETPASFTAEGIVTWLTGGSDEARTLLGHTIFNVVTMANPDGVALGNYRTTSTSVNLETQWGAPYTSTVPEIVALRSKIEEFMGTAAAPGANPITMLLNLHASHNETYPFHFVHAAGYPTAGVTPAVRALEDRWVSAFKDTSSFGALRTTDPVSTLAGRNYVESMMNDRYSTNPAWKPVMAITLEGGYQAGPVAGVPNTPDDYRQMGTDMGSAIADFYGVDLRPITVMVAAGQSLSQTAAGHATLAGTLPARKTGAGTLLLDAANTISGSTVIQQGTLRLLHPLALVSSTVSTLTGGTLSLAPGLHASVGGLKPLAGGSIDVGTGVLTVRGGLSPASLVAALLTGRGDGTWNGSTGIVSSAVADDLRRGVIRTIGWVDHGDGSVAFGYAAPGDTDLDGMVDLLDVAAVVGSGKFNSGMPAVWAEGDFNEDGLLDLLDLAEFASADVLNTGPYASAFSGVVAVPEPGGLRVVWLGMAAWITRLVRRRSSGHPSRSMPLV